MPIYAYRCADCGHAKDVLRKLSDPPLATCPACGAEAFEKQVTAAGFQLKGSGWYVTDFKGGAPAAKPADAAAAASGGAPAKPADGTPAKSEGTAAKSEGGPAKADAPAKPSAPAAESSA
jgi:putative FmdB family regulatory protein